MALAWTISEVGQKGRRTPEPDSLGLIHRSALTSFKPLATHLSPLCFTFLLSLVLHNSICHIQSQRGLSEIKCGKCLEQCLACHKYPISPRDISKAS